MTDFALSNLLQPSVYLFKLLDTYFLRLRIHAIVPFDPQTHLYTSSISRSGKRSDIMLN